MIANLKDENIEEETRTKIKIIQELLDKTASRIEIFKKVKKTNVKESEEII